MGSEKAKQFQDKLEHWLSLKTWAGKKPPQLSPQGYPYATFNRRMMASVIDAAIIALLMVPFNNEITQYMYQDFKPDTEYLKLMREVSTSEEEYQIAVIRHMVDAGLGTIFAKMFQLQYFIIAVFSYICWHFYSATPGKIILNMRIVHVKTGEKITDWQSFVRVVGYMVSGLAFMLGFFAIVWNRNKQGWHDKMAKTAVVVLLRSPEFEDEDSEDTAKLAPEADRPSDFPAPATSE